MGKTRRKNLPPEEQYKQFVESLQKRKPNKPKQRSHYHTVETNYNRQHNRCVIEEELNNEHTDN